MRNLFYFAFFLLVIVITILDTLLQFATYLVYTAAYFIQDNWLMIFATLIALGALGINKKEQKAGAGAVAALLVCFQLGSNWYVTDGEKREAENIASELVRSYEQMGMKTTIEGNEITTNINTKLSKLYLLREEDEFLKGFEKGLVAPMGEKYKNFKLYREAELLYRDFRQGGGKVTATVNDRDGNPVYKMIITGLEDISLERV